MASLSMSWWRYQARDGIKTPFLQRFPLRLMLAFMASCLVFTDDVNIDAQHVQSGLDKGPKLDGGNVGDKSW